MSDRLKKRHRYLKIALIMLEEMCVLIRYKAATVYEIVDSLKKDNRFSDLNFLQKIQNKEDQKRFSDQWRTAIAECPVYFLKAKDLSCIEALGSNLGNSDIEGQLSTLLLEKEELKYQISEAAEDIANKSRLYRTLGVLSGAFISVIII